MGVWTDRIKRAGEALLGAHELDTVNGISKALPTGAVPRASMAADADRMTGRAPSLGITGEPAMGDPVNPGPRPVESERVDVMGEPQRFQFPYAYNQTWTPRRYALTPFQTLRMMADVADIIRICIETRKEQVSSLSFDIVSRDKKKKAADSTGIAAAKAAFARPDKKRTFQTWLSMAIEEILVIDALSIYRRKTRKGAHFSWELKDGSTILPLLDNSGDTPSPPEIAYRQIIYGRPGKGGDTTIDELYYRPRCVRTHTPYGCSPTEAVLLTINAALNREMFNLRYYTDGNIPHAMLDAPKDWNKEQIQQFQNYLDEYFSGDLAARRRIKVVANGMAQSLKTMAEPDFTGKYDEWLVKVICAAFSVPPQEIGFTADVNKATGEMQENVTYRRGVKPLTGFLADLFNEMLEFDLGMPEMMVVFSGGESEDQFQQAQADKLYVDMGKTTIDELRERDGEEPFGGAAARPFLMTPQGPLFLDDLEENPILHPNQQDQSEKVPARDPIAEAAAAAASAGDAGKDGKPPAPGQQSGEKQPAKQDDEQNTEKFTHGDLGLVIDEAAHDDLRRWRTVAVNCVRKGQPTRPFVSEEIPVYLQAEITRRLRYAPTISAVHKAFDLAVDDYLFLKRSKRFSDDELAMQTKVKSLVKTSLRKLGNDLVDHLAEGDALTQKAAAPPPPPAPQIIVNVPAQEPQAAPVVNVTVEAAKVDVPAQPAPVVNVTVERETQKTVHKRVERDGAGRITGIVEEPEA
jgi:hypothetical protein